MSVTDQQRAEPRWIFGAEAACRLIAAASWPYERQENRDAWAVAMLHRPELLATEIAAARARLEAAIAHLTALAGPSPTDEGGES